MALLALWDGSSLRTLALLKQKEMNLTDDEVKQLCDPAGLWHSVCCEAILTRLMGIVVRSGCESIRDEPCRFSRSHTGKVVSKPKLGAGWGSLGGVSFQQG